MKRPALYRSISTLDQEAKAIIGGLCLTLLLMLAWMLFRPKTFHERHPEWTGNAFVLDGKAEVNLEHDHMALIGSHSFLVDKQDRWISQEWNPVAEITARPVPGEAGHFLLVNSERNETVRAVEVPNLPCFSDLLNCDDRGMVPNGKH